MRSEGYANPAHLPLFTLSASAHVFSKRVTLFDIILQKPHAE